ncbi:MAG TPA: enoyl-CoA hydratase-related protein [Pseudolabrys sp.]|nr:enoyl-CoA hydratase-related protein [Pseudolabrys sp.]
MGENEELSVQGLSFRTDGCRATIIIDNAAEGNRLTAAAIEALSRVAAILRMRDDLHVVLIRGVGSEDFSSGILNPVLRGRMTKEEVVQLVMQAAAAFDAIEAVPQIVVAGLNGNVRAGGVELALACDIRFASNHISASLPEARWGGFPGAGGPLRLARLVGRPRALELICTGRDFSAAEMEAIGFVQKIVPESNFDRELSAFLSSIESNGPLALRGAKEIMKVDEELGFNAARKVALLLRRQLEWSVDVDEGIRAHQENRVPKFLGN